jgi:hypothetical protein
MYHPNDLIFLLISATNFKDCDKIRYPVFSTRNESKKGFVLRLIRKINKTDKILIQTQLVSINVDKWDYSPFVRQQRSQKASHQLISPYWKGYKYSNKFCHRRKQEKIFTTRVSNSQTQKLCEKKNLFKMYALRIESLHNIDTFRP